MEHAKKFILVSADSLARMGSTPNIQQEHAASLRQEMDRLLQHRDLPEDRKMAAYNQHQYDYFTQRESMNRPLKISIHDREEEDAEELSRTLKKPRKILTSAVDYFQKAYQENANGLGRFLMESVPNVHWNESGEVIVDNKLIYGSSLLALMDDVIRRRATKQPTGYREFSSALIQANLPENLIGETTGLYRPTPVGAYPRDVHQSPFESTPRRPRHQLGDGVITKPLSAGKRKKKPVQYKWERY